MSNTSKTDLERYVELYKSFGINCKIINEGGFKLIILSEGSMVSESEKHTTSILFNGYNSFYTKIIFSEDGGFVSQGFWE